MTVDDEKCIPRVRRKDPSEKKKSEVESLSDTGHILRDKKCCKHPLIGHMS